MRYGTKFLETEAILAAVEENTAYLDELVKKMTDSEIRQLINASVVLQGVLEQHVVERFKNRRWGR